jgi:ATP-binding protein involved in chromosome partitioning
MPLPIEIIGLGRNDLTIVWDEGHEGKYLVRDLRLRCRCALCVEEMTGRPLLDPSKVPDLVTIETMELVGSYGIQIRFSDQHSTGIFRFDDLINRCPCARCSNAAK